MGFGFWRGWDIVGQFLVVLVVVTGWIGPDIWLTWQVERRQIDVDLALPNLLDRFALSLEAGTSFDLALKRIVVNFPGLLGADLRRMVRQLDRGYPRAEALDELAERNPSQDLRAFIAAVKQADRLGTSLVRALRVQTELLRSRRRRRAEEASRRLPILIIFPLVFFFLPALLIVYLAPPILHLFLGF
jgi:tight adherence protein C